MEKRCPFPIEYGEDMELKLSTCFITVDDHDKALAFYRDVLGFTVGADVKYEGMRWLTVSPPAQPDIQVVMQSPGASANVSKDDQRAVAELLAKGILPGLIFTTPDVDATFEQIRASGAEVLQEPMDMPYGVRDCAFRDPAGNMLRFNQPKA
jgi:predicted enzyme related to lactoylglutathione lyase